MTVELYTGTPGSGKSYHALARGLMHIGPAWSRNSRWVVANFPIRPAHPRWLFVEDPTVRELVELSRSHGWFGREGRCLLIIDEAGVKFNSRDWARNPRERMEWIKFFSQHRKLGYDVILVTQEDRMLDRQIRAQAELEVRHLQGKRIFPISLVPWPWPVFLTVTYFYHTRLRGSLGFLALQPWLARRYDTMRMFWDADGSGAGEGGPAQAGGPLPAPGRADGPEPGFQVCL